MLADFTALEANLISLGHLPKANVPACIPCYPPTTIALGQRVDGLKPLVYQRDVSLRIAAVPRLNGLRRSDSVKDSHADTTQHQMNV